MLTTQRIGQPRPGSATLAACAALAVACTAAPAQADSLSASRAVTPPGVVACDHSLATSPAGGRVALLYHAGTQCGGEQDHLYARLGRGRNLGPPLVLEDRISRSGAKRVSIFGAARVAVGANGGAVAAWIARGRESGRDDLRVAIAAPGRRFGPARTLSRASFRQGYVPRIELIGVIAGSAGRVVVSWTLRHGDRSPAATLRAAVRTPGGRFGAPQSLGPFSVVFSSRSAPALALAPSGTVVAAWRPGAQPTAAAATLRPGRRRFDATRTISGDDAADHVQAVAGPGGAAVSWSDDRRTIGSPIRLRVARLRRDGTLAAPSTLAAVDAANGALEVDGPQVALPFAGPVAAWLVFRDISEGGDGAMDSTRIDATSAAGAGPLAALTLSTAGALTGAPIVGALTDRVLVAWRERLAPDRWRLRLAVRGAAGDWQPARTFADTDGTMAIAAGTRSALLLWQPFAPRGQRGRLRLAVYRP
jgi:hypothetical protein